MKEAPDGMGLGGRLTLKARFLFWNKEPFLDIAFRPSGEESLAQCRPMHIGITLPNA
jgi:hypothetical protein